MQDNGIQARNEQFDAIRDELSERQARVYRRVINAGPHGITLDELADHLDRTPNQISGRVTELKQRSLVTHTKSRRATRSGGTASVIVANQFLN